MPPTYTETLEVTLDTASDVALDVSLHGASTFRVLADGTTTSPTMTSKAPLASPTFTGVPAAPTAVASTSTTQLATTAFVTTADNLKAPLASPSFTGAITIGAGASTVGFYAHAPVALQTGVAVSAAGVHAALVALGLITA